MLAGHRPTNGLDGLCGVLVLAAFQLLHDDQTLVAVFPLDGKGRGGFATQGRMALLGGKLDVLRVVVATANDNQVLQPPGAVQLATMEKAQVAGAQVRAFARVFDKGTERLLGFFGPVPIALGHAGTGDPDFAHFALGTFAAGFGIDDDYVQVRQPLPAADQTPRAGSPRGGFHHRVLFQLSGIDRQNHRRIRLVASGGNQRTFGQSVAGVERLVPETARGEPLGEPLQGFGADWLGAVEGHLPGAKVQLVELFGTDAFQAQLVGEVRPPAGGAPVAGDGLEPSQRPLQESHGGHEDVGPAHVQRLDNPANQAHIVVRREPEHAGTAAGMFEGVANQGRVVQQVGVGEHHPVGCARGAGRVLQHGQRGTVHAGVFPVFFAAGGDGVGLHPGQVLQERCLGQHVLHPLPHVAGGQGHLGLGVLGDGLDAIQRAVHSRRVGRHGHHPGVQTAKKRRDELQPGRKQQQRPLALQPLALQVMGNSPGQAIQLLVGQGHLLGFAIDQKAVGSRLGLVLGPVFQQGNQGRRAEERAGKRLLGHVEHLLGRGQDVQQR